MERIEITAETLDEAITKATIELGVPSDSLDYTVIKTGSKGFFGFGAKPYVISACVKGAEKKAEAKPEPKKEVKKPETVREVKPEPKKESPKPVKVQEEKSSEKAPEVKEVKAPEAKEERKPKKNDRPKNDKHRNERKDAPKKPAAEKPQKEVKAPKEIVIVPVSAERIAEAETAAKDFLTSVFGKMDMQVNMEMTFDNTINEMSLMLTGDDMGVLIGKRGKTLDALQYLVSQVINKHQSNYIRVKLDTENYRERRKETLETLAENTAQKAKRIKRPVALEPMNPYERRIIHSVLQQDKDVTTRSEGEEPYRHVVVCPVRKRNR